MKKYLSAFLCTLLATTAIAQAGARRFTYTYEAAPAAPGSFEIENWVTWKTERRGDPRYRQFDFRHEVEFGVTERLQMAVYAADWTYQRGDSFDRAGSVYTGTAVELIYNLTNPATAPLGSALYGELKVADELVKLEGKILLQKNLGRFVVAYNGTIEAEWEGDDLEERTGELQQTLGVSYEITPRFLVGAELLHEVELPDWRTGEDHAVYAGPNVSLRAGKWWVTATALAQLTSASEPDLQVRTIVGYTF